MSISASFGQAGASEKTAESAVRVITFYVLALQQSTPKRALKKDLEQTSTNVPEAPTVTDSDDLESQLGPGGGPGLLFCPRFFLGFLTLLLGFLTRLLGFLTRLLGFLTRLLGFPTLL